MAPGGLLMPPAMGEEGVHREPRGGSGVLLLLGSSHFSATHKVQQGLRRASVGATCSGAAAVSAD